MAIKINIKGKNEEIMLEKDNIQAVKFFSDTPNDSNARATDLGISIEVIGKIISTVNDVTKKLSFWSLIPAESNDCYRKLELLVVNAGIVQRKIIMPDAFLIDYEEKFDIQSGTGMFKMLLKQKKEKIEDISIEGGYNAE